MDSGIIIGIILLVLGIAVFGVFIYFYFSPREEADFKSLMSGMRAGGGFASSASELDRPDLAAADFLKLKEDQRKRAKKRVVYTLEQKFFMAGMFTDQDKREFQRMRIIFPLVMAPLMAIVLGWLAGTLWAIVGFVFGLLLGFQAPFSIVDRRINQRGEEIMYYLPLVIEQIAIGVSSSLDIGPCIQRVITMSDERDSHNVVTELIRVAHNFVRSGASLEDALSEVGKLSGHTELKHTFMSLAQVARHGGEITKQLQELADAVASQRETKIEGKIKKLELVATGPVALVFAGFLIILLIGFGLQVSAAFN